MESGKTILLVDDDADAREVNVLCLQSAGFRIVEAAHGDQALARLAEGIPDAIITDLRMPTMNGLELARRLRSNATYLDIPVGLLTGSPPHHPDDISFFNEILIKPSGFNDLLAMAARLAGHGIVHR
ncbi:response regulator [Herbaspirillum robiniae]|uniref:response regulator n=1 Tax=Herbaspirillum robiniae TaxID=2014887 RepID=UPI003D775AEA